MPGHAPSQLLAFGPAIICFAERPSGVLAAISSCTLGSCIAVAQMSQRSWCHLCTAPIVTISEHLLAASSAAHLCGTSASRVVCSCCCSESEFKGILAQLVKAGKLPEKLEASWIDFYDVYKQTVTNSGVADPELVATKIQCTIADCVINQFMDPYTFPSAHKRLLEPYNYYNFGQRYVSSLIDFNNSFVGHAERWNKIAEQLAAGENVVLLANHQTEADPGVFAHMLESSQPKLATDVIYVAGDRVVTDALCKPFSMGRNLFCVHR